MTVVVGIYWINLVRMSIDDIYVLYGIMYNDNDE
jgi:hypothetical protein